MKFYEVRYLGGDYEDGFDEPVGYYDSLDRAISEAESEMKRLETFSQHWEEDIDCFYINEWELNSREPSERDIRCWFRANEGKYGKFVTNDEFLEDSITPYDNHANDRDYKFRV